MTDERDDDDFMWVRWQDDFRHCFMPSFMSPEAVAAYLVLAFEMLRYVPVRDKGPSSEGVLWPSYFHDAEDRAGWFKSEREKEQQFVRPRFSPQQVTFMEAVIYWPIRILGPLEYQRPPLAQIVGMYAAAKAHGWSFRKIYLSQGWNRDTVYRRVALGHEIIASRLNSGAT